MILCEQVAHEADLIIRYPCHHVTISDFYAKAKPLHELEVG